MQKTPQAKVTGNGLGLTFILHTPMNNAWPSEPLSSKPQGNLMPAVLLKNFLSLISGLCSSKCKVTESSRGPQWWTCRASLIGVLGVFPDCLGIRGLRIIDFVWLLCKSLSSVLIRCKKGTQVTRIFEAIGRNMPHSLVIEQSTDPSANRWVFECWRGCSCVRVHTCNPSTKEVEQEDSLVVTRLWWLLISNTQTHRKGERESLQLTPSKQTWEKNLQRMHLKNSF